MSITVGLFGTCDNSKWREPFIAEYEAEGINYFNPVVEDWNPGCVPIEKEHFESDEILLFPILAESYGQGSLSELGFSVLRALRASKARILILLIDPEVEPRLMEENALRAKDSNRSRALVRSYVESIEDSRVIVVKSLLDMLTASLRAHELLEGLDALHADLA
jgi:hypothetical protein